MVADTPQKRSGPTCATSTKPTLDHQPSRERMKIMARHSSATTREETSRRRDEKSDNSPRARGDAGAPSSNSSLKSHGIDASLKRRARLLVSNGSIPRQTR